jgi:hypothetical protein
MSTMLWHQKVPVSADSAQTAFVTPAAPARVRDENSDLFSRCVLTYRAYHEVDSLRVVTPSGQRRLRLVGPRGSERLPDPRYVSLDLEDFQ